MLGFILDHTPDKPGKSPALKLALCLSILVLCSFPSASQDTNSSVDSGPGKSKNSKITYENPRVYNVDYTFELFPDTDSIDPSKDLKLWITVPREWDSQKGVKIISVEPEPHARYTDPEHGNKILFWDFGKEPEKDMHVVKIKYRAQVFEVYSEVEPEKIGSYNMKSEEYQLYTRSTHSTTIKPEIKEIALSVVGDEKNPYLQAMRIFDYVVKNMRYTDISRERGSNIESILNYAVTDPETGEKHFEGVCAHYSVFFVALCRAAGIPARGVCGFVGWGPWIEEKDLKLRSNRHTLLTSEGLAATRLYGPMGGHIWAEFYLPGYGWIPADPTWNQFGFQGNIKLTITKGRDVKIGPNATKMDDGVYGDQWIPLHNGRAATIGWGVWSIAKIRVAKAKVLHTSDPFPADAFADYATNLYPEGNTEEKLRNWRKEITLSFNNAAKKNTNKNLIFKKDKRLNAARNAYLCQVLCDITGDEAFLQIFKTYLDLQRTSSKPVSTDRFREIARQVHGAPLDFFFEEWVGNQSLPQLRLKGVMVEKREKNWRVHGRIQQEGKIFHIPLELTLDTENGRDQQKIWLDSIHTRFEFITSSKPMKLIVDQDYHIPIVRWIPPRLGNLWDSYPELIVIYGTLSEAEANKKAAELFSMEFAELGQKIIKADSAVTEDDLRRNLILFGRPETNKITQKFQDNFPVKFEKDRFSWQGVVYNSSTQGVALIVENPFDNRNTVNLYAGLSGDATLKACDKTEWQEELDGWFIIDYNSSYIIYDKHKRLVSGDWADTGSDLVWCFTGPLME